MSGAASDIAEPRAPQVGCHRADRDGLTAGLAACNDVGRQRRLGLIDIAGGEDRISSNCDRKRDAWGRADAVAAGHVVVDDAAAPRSRIVGCSGDEHPRESAARVEAVRVGMHRRQLEADGHVVTAEQRQQAEATAEPHRTRLPRQRQQTPKTGDDATETAARLALRLLQNRHRQTFCAKGLTKA